MYIILWIIILLFYFSLPSFPEGIQVPGNDRPPPLEIIDNLRINSRDKEAINIDLTALFKGYEGYCRGLDTKGSEKLSIIMRNRVKVLYDEGKKKNFEEKLANADLKDMLSQLYQPGKPAEVAPPDYDPGRFRDHAFLGAVYGETPEQVRTFLVPVNFCGVMVEFNSQNGAAQALERVSQKLRAVVREKPELGKYIFPLGRIFNWRRIAGTDRMSPHCWAIAIDLNPRYGEYWRWPRLKNLITIPARLRMYPLEIIKVFEECRFIWGGKWWHFDSLHFEYRPEMFIKAELVKRMAN